MGVFKSRWTEAEFGQVRKLRVVHKKTYAEIGQIIGRTEAAVRDKCLKELMLQHAVTSGCYGGPAIGADDATVRFQHDARRGSAKLLAALMKLAA